MGIAISVKMMGALMFMLDIMRDFNPPMLTPVLAKYGDEAVEFALLRLYYPIEKRTLPAPFDEVEREILRLCVENSLWLRPYVESGPTPAHLEEARSTLRQLARVLEGVGVEITHIPFE
jgi:hypothetical protein